MNWIQQYWKDHGTKISGFVLSIIGTLTLRDHETLDLIGQALGPVWGVRAKQGVLILGGLMVARRGFTNTQQLNK
jgi:hypothetical protein